MMLRTAALLVLMGVASGLPACTGAEYHVLTFAPGEHATEVQDLRVDIIEARFAERELTVQCALVNEGDTPVQISRAGVLLEDDGLELPPVQRPGQPEETRVAGGASASAVFSFELAAREPRVRTLGLWIVTRDGQPIPPLRVEVPGIRTNPS